jgi:hypothetical protein
MAENIFDVIKKEHEDVRRRLDDARADPSRFSAFADRLRAHLTAEEAAFYHYLKDEDATKQLMLDALHQHHTIDLVVAHLGHHLANTDHWTARFKVMARELERHFEREESGVFAAAGRLLIPQRAVVMAHQYERAEHDADNVYARM